MKIDSINQVNFKAVYIKDDGFNSREQELANYISGRLLGGRKSGDKKSRNWNEWLKEEKGIDVFVKRAKNTCDMLTVFGVKNAKDFDEAKKLRNFFVVGNYHTTDFEPEDVMEAHKDEKRSNAIAFGTLIFAGVCFLGAILGNALLVKKPVVNKEVPEKVIQMKDSIADSLKIFKLNDKIKK